MSADNGIYILKTRDQYRVAHLQAIDNVYWSYADGDWRENQKTKGKLVPTRVVEMWGQCKHTKNAEKAYEIAEKWKDSLPVCEYGIRVLAYHKTWAQIVGDAEKYAGWKLNVLEEYQNGREECGYLIKNMRRWFPNGG